MLPQSHSLFGDCHAVAGFFSRLWMPGTDIADVADEANAAIEYLTESWPELTPGVEDATKPAG